MEQLTEGIILETMVAQGSWGPTFRGRVKSYDRIIKLVRPRCSQSEFKFDWSESEGEVGPRGWGQVREGRYQGCLYFHRPIGQSLRPPLDQRQVIEVARDVAQALESLHNSGRRHGNLRPSNILLHAGRWRLADAGLRDLLEHQAVVENPPRERLCYRAPEFVSGIRSEAEDIWSLGAVLLELLTGKRPILGRELNWLKAVRQNPWPELPNLPERFRRLLEACLAPPESRWTAGQLLALLERRPVPGITGVAQPQKVWRETVLDFETYADPVWDFSVDGKLLALTGEEEVRLFEVGSRTLVGYLPLPVGETRQLLFSPDGEKLLWWGGEELPAHLFEVKNGKLVTQLQGSQASGPFTFVDAMSVAAADLGLWRVDNGSQLRTGGARRRLVPDLWGCWNWKGREFRITEVTVQGTSKTLTYKADEDGFKAGLATFHKGRLLACAPEPRVAAQGEEHLLLAPVGTRLETLGEHAAPVEALASSPDGKLLASSSADGSLKFWDLETRTLKGRIPAHPAPRSLQFSRDGEVFSWGAPRLLKSIRIDALDQILERPAQVAYKPLRGLKLGRQPRVALSYDGRFLAVGGSQNLAVFHTTRKKPIWQALASHRPRRMCLTDVLLATCSATGKLLVRDLKSGEGLWEADNVCGLAADPRGILTTLTTEGLLQWWSPRGRELHRMQLPEPGLDLAYSRDGRTLITSGNQRDCLWERGEEGHWNLKYRDFPRPASPDRVLCLSADGQQVITSDDNKLEWWGRSRKEPPARAAAFGPSDRVLALARPHGIELYDSVDGRMLGRLAARAEGTAASLAVAPKLLAAAWDDGQISVFALGGDW